MSTPKEVVRLFSEDPIHLKTLELTTNHEEQNAANQHCLACECYDTGIHSAKLARLITSDIAHVSLKSNKANFFMFKDRAVVKRALTQVGEKKRWQM
jgi:hypothetical protein